MQTNTELLTALNNWNAEPGGADIWCDILEAVTDIEATERINRRDDHLVPCVVETAEGMQVLDHCAAGDGWTLRDYDPDFDDLDEEE